MRSGGWFWLLHTKMPRQPHGQVYQGLAYGCPETWLEYEAMARCSSSVA